MRVTFCRNYRAATRGKQGVMISVTRSGVLTADQRQPSRTVHDWRRKFGLTGDILFRIFLSLCYVTGTCCASRDSIPDRMLRGTKELQIALSRPPQPGHCDLEKSCDWSWKQTDGFKRVTAPIRSRHGPTMDASQTERGNRGSGEHVPFIAFDVLRRSKRIP